MVGKLILAGGGNEKQSFVIDEYFLNGVKKVLYVPLAWPDDNFSGCLEWFTGAMAKHKKVGIDMLVDWKKSIDLRRYDAVYVGGGNTFKLLKRLREGGFDKSLPEFLKHGGTVYGGSAGAIIWGNKIDIALICKDKDKNLVKLVNTSGFNFVNGFDIQCHYDGEQEQEHLEYVQKNRRNVIAIPEESALVFNDGNYSVVGRKPLFVFRDTKMEKYNVGDNVVL